MKGGLPKRYQEPLKKLNERKYLIISQAYKGGGVVVMNNNFYVENMLHLLNDERTCRNIGVSFPQREADALKNITRKYCPRRRVKER